jgi:hypothetical protein
MVTETARTLCTILESPGGHATMGMVTEHGTRPTFMVVADIFGDHVAAWSYNQTIIREMCACSYGSVDSGFGMGSAMRSDVDCMVDMVKSLPRDDADASPPSIALVLCAPWGLGIGERFWRLFSIRTGVDGKIIDSEFVLTSLNPPPCRQGRSVFGDYNTRATSEQVDAFRRTTRGMCIDAITDTALSPTTVIRDEPVVSNDGLETVSKQRYDVSMSIVRELRAQLSSMKEQLDGSHRDRDAQVARMTQLKVEEVEMVMHSNLTNLYTQLNDERMKVQNLLTQQTQVAVFVSVLEQEIIKFEKDTFILTGHITDLNGKLLVSDDTCEVHKRTHSSMSKRNMDLEKNMRVLQMKFDAHVEAAASERSSAVDELLTVKRRLEESKQTAASALSSVYDARDADVARLRAAENMLRREIEQTKASMKEQTSKRVRLLCHYASSRFLEAGASRRSRRNAACRLASHAFVSILHRVRYKRRVQAELDDQRDAHTPNTTGGEAATPSQPVRPTGSHTRPFPADAVSSAKACISVLEQFVDRAQTNNMSTYDTQHAAVPVETKLDTPDAYGVSDAPGVPNSSGNPYRCAYYDQVPQEHYMQHPTALYYGGYPYNYQPCVSTVPTAPNAPYSISSHAKRLTSAHYTPDSFTPAPYM